MIKTSIILTAYDRIEDTIRCLNALHKLCTDEMQVLIMHDHHKASKELMKACENLSFLYIHSGKQKANKEMWRVPGFALNIGVRQSLGSNLIIGNSEIFIQECISNQIQKIEEGYICGPKILAQGVGREHYYRGFLPFFLGVPRKVYEAIGGYDEDFVGSCYDDDDFIERATTLAPFLQLDEVAVHLEHLRDMQHKQTAVSYNYELYKARKGTVERNLNKEWGNIDELFVRSLEFK